MAKQQKQQTVNGTPVKNVEERAEHGERAAKIVRHIDLPEPKPTLQQLQQQLQRDFRRLDEGKIDLRQFQTIYAGHFASTGHIDSSCMCGGNSCLFMHFHGSKPDYITVDCRTKEQKAAAEQMEREVHQQGVPA